ncbi:MAG: hypothetical protein K0R47_4805, partial [Brevibacillus sp.]|nr:hypothetical protein [Brevibacillus sp.]
YDRLRRILVEVGEQWLEVAERSGEKGTEIA